MDKKRGLLNIGVSIFFKVVLLIESILVRRYLIQYIGNDANGLSPLFTSIIGFLTVAELGVGETVTFYMYKPVVEGAEEKVAALYILFKKLYKIDIKCRLKEKLTMGHNKMLGTKIIFMVCALSKVKGM